MRFLGTGPAGGRSGRGCSRRLESSLVVASREAMILVDVTRDLAAFCAGCDLLVLDGAMWGRTLYTHLELQTTAPVVARWPVRRVLFTQLCRSTPPHAVLDRWLHGIDPRLGAAYDGLALAISRRRVSVLASSA